MFRGLPAATYGQDDAESIANLKKLGDTMTADFDRPKDGSDAEESGIPALYTYFGQFVDHDITFDPMTTLIAHSDPDGLTDFRTPALDLDNVYGRGPADQPYMYDGDRKFLLGDKIGGGNDPDAVDLPRNKPADPSRARALIGDPRNDENAIVSQLQGLFLRFHNRLADEHPELTFRQLQQQVRFHYQYIILNDFLPRLVRADVLADLKTGQAYDSTKIRFYNWTNDPFMPVEFSVAAYRLGHSMVRPGYRLNDTVLLPIFPVPAHGFVEGLTGFRPMIPAWGLDWGRFIDIDIRSYGSSDPADVTTQKRLQFAYRIDTSLVNPLGQLPGAVADTSSLAARNLVRSFNLGLPSGQDVARAMGVTPLDDIEIKLGKAVDAPQPGDGLGSIASIPELAPFKGKCPLWTYILAEAAHCQTSVLIPVTEAKTISTPQLGSVGGRIVAEVFLGMMFGDPDSLLSMSPYWTPAAGPAYALKDFVRYALGH